MIRFVDIAADPAAVISAARRRETGREAVATVAPPVATDTPTPAAIPSRKGRKAS